MATSYFLADTNSLIYAYRAGGPQLLDTYRKVARAEGHEFAITKTIETEIEDGPLKQELSQYIADRKIKVLDAAETQQKVRSDPEKFSKNAGERSLLEIATREHAEGRSVIIWSDDKLFASPQIQRQLQRELPGLRTTTTAELVDRTFRDGTISEAEYQQHVVGYRKLSDFQDSPRLNSFDPALSAASVDLDQADEALRGPKGQSGSISKDLLVGERPIHTLARSGGLLATGVDLTLSAQRSAELLEQGNLRAAQSESSRTIARNAGAWIGGTTAAYVVGSSGYVPVALIVADAALLAKAADKAVDLVEDYQIHHQADKNGVVWTFADGNWVRPAALDKTPDGISNPVAGVVGANYEKARELGYHATNEAVELALGKMPPPQDPFNLPARESDRAGLDNNNWRRDPAAEQWVRSVKVAETGANDRGVYEQQIASSQRADELSRESLGRIQTNIATGREAVAMVYQENYAAQRWRDFGGIPGAVVSATPQRDTLMASDKTVYQRGEARVWSSDGKVAQGNLELELELTRAARQPSLEQHNQRLASLESRPAPTAEQKQQNELLHRYRVADVELNPDWQEAVVLATRRTREEHGLAGPGSMQLQNKTGGKTAADNAVAADSPIAHYRRGPDGVERIAAVTSTQDIEQALKEVRAGRQERAPLPDVPDMRIAAQSPQERDAYQQALREANRQGVSTQEAQTVATLAAVEVRAPRVDGAQRRAEVESPVERERDVAAQVPVSTGPVMPALQAAVVAPELEDRAQGQGREAVTSSVQSVRPAIPQSFVVADAPSAAVQATAVPAFRSATPATFQSQPPVQTPDAVARSVSSADVSIPQSSKTNGRTIAVEVSVAPDVATAERVPVVAAASGAPEGLRLGDRGNDVEFLQFRLQRGGARGPEGQPVAQDGYYGVETEYAVRQFQQAHDLPATGVADQTVDMALAQAPRPGPGSPTPLRQVMPAQAVAEPTVERSNPEIPPAQAPVANEAQPLSVTRHEARIAARQTLAGSFQGASLPAAETRVQMEDAAHSTNASPGPGSPGGKTRRQEPERDDAQATAAQPDRPSQSFPSDHPDYALFAAIQARLPKDTQDGKTAELMHAAKLGGVDRVDKFKDVVVVGDRAFAYGHVPGFYGNVSLTASAPELEDTLKRTQAFDQQQALEMEQFQQQQEELNRNHTDPVMKLGAHTLQPAMSDGSSADGGGGDG
ncbi:MULTISPECIES: peptidoglycan-binding domain-containing protein [unclassified Lysobacter]|uniref:peptidoglycan-binding domain-containing protein n=1 Tax=unclassified Lysobacter TaxID=2635362 RepID=UPI001BE63895|nr:MULTISPECIES: peptidoglycan-binding domain-containing protein [unclassified Lysobacter]MBT2746550.1 peptidoglycan-binding protein [Lysobacter sp. ISL-42]MBT2754003.1 peptidoglycan-binding protein [Lysobacter sp. ISL-50]MBT2778923.1 peptidoglycan-binding protein [Lysobacter sp. ISL-54]MBT2782500.1 peptidoglycan-binding protein [Lysobacter sp. ISL-52]